MIIRWNTASGQEIWRLQVESREINTLAISHAGTIFAAGDATGTLWIGEMSSGSILYLLKGHEQGIARAVFRSDDQMLLSASADGSVNLWWRHTPETLKQWLKQDHYTRELTCDERREFSLPLPESCPQQATVPVTE